MSVTMQNPVSARSRMTPTPRNEPTPHEIIRTARANPASARGTLILGLISAALMWCSFTPLEWSPLGWISLLPMLTLIRLERPTRWMYRTLYLTGVLFWLATLQWMRLGDPTMYIAWAAISLYLGLVFPLFVGITRVAVRHLNFPLVLAAPVVWVGIEYARAFVLTGFSWYYLGHSQYRWLDLIQVSDLVGGYGVSFLMVADAAALSLLIPQNWMRRIALFPPADFSGDRSPPVSLRSQRNQIVAASLLFLAVLGYGYWRRSGTEFPAGPRVAAIQGNFPTSVRNDHDPLQVYTQHMSLSGQATKLQPDLIVWPEGMFPWPYAPPPADLTKDEIKLRFPQFASRWEDKGVENAFADIAQKSGAAVVIGCQTLTANRNGLQFFNSAAFITPEQGIVSRYDKIHRVPFGEYLPLADFLPFLGRLTPYRGEFGIQAGTHPVVMEHNRIRYAPIICFEDTIPHLVTQIVRETAAQNPDRKDLDVLLNLSNDGWFHGSSELDQHLITAAFRSVECRIPMVRAVNTGISAVIDGDGAIRARAKNELTGKSRQTEAFLVESVPLDPRSSLYARYGDWFAFICLCLSGISLLSGFSRRHANHTNSATTPLMDTNPAEKLA